MSVTTAASTPTVVQAPLRRLLLHVHWRIWHLTGIIIGPGRFVIFHRVATIIPTLSLVTMWTSMLWSLAEDGMTQREATYVLVLSLLFMMFSVKMVLFRTQSERLVRVVRLVLQMEARTTPEERRDVLAGRVQTMWALVWGTIGGVVVSTLVLLTAMIRDAERSLLYPTRLPAFVDWRHNNAAYAVSMAWQLVTASFASLLCLTGDYLGPNLYVTLDGFLEILSQRTERIGWDREDDGKYRLGQTEPAEEVARLFHGELVECVELHRECVQLARHTDDMFSIQYFVQFSANTIAICAITILIVQSADPDMYTVWLCIALILASQIFLPCYCAAQVNHRSATLYRCAYSANWMDAVPGSPAVGAAVRLFGGSMMRPMRFHTAGHIFDISLPTFVSIMRKAYSLFSCISQME